MSVKSQYIILGIHVLKFSEVEQISCLTLSSAMIKTLYSLKYMVIRRTNFMAALLSFFVKGSRTTKTVEI